MLQMENVHPAGVMGVKYLSDKFPTLLWNTPLSETNQGKETYLPQTDQLCFVIVIIVPEMGRSD